MEVAGGNRSSCAEKDFKMALKKRQPDDVSNASSSPEPADRKRKREDIPEDEKLEIDVSAPEPPSKKAKRLEKKKAKSQTTKKPAKPSSTDPKVNGNDETGEASSAPAPEAAAAPKRSDHGIWIGNLPFTCTKDRLREFFRDDGGIPESDIVRLHMPTPSDKASKASNKGFAYVDFTSPEHVAKAVVLSEKLVGGRRVLIKDAKSFEGRPDKKKEEAAGGGDGKEGLESGNRKTGKKDPAKRIFVGNLSFDVTSEELAEHFSQAGEVADIHMATFEDSGKCKGFAWVRFNDVEAASAAVRGFIYVRAEDSESEDEGEEEVDNADAGRKKKKKVRRNKKHINRLHGRELRCEFAEDAQTRYKKRFGSGKGKGANSMPLKNARAGFEESPADAGAEEPRPDRRAPRMDKEQRREERSKRHLDARKVAPGAALAGAQRGSAAILAGAGKRVTFE